MLKNEKSGCYSEYKFTLPFARECIARSGVPHAAKCGWHSLVHFVLEAKMEMSPMVLPHAVPQYIFVW
jgi:hypothetical protein